jgi:hypothetical protein
MLELPIGPCAICGLPAVVQITNVNDDGTAWEQLFCVDHAPAEVREAMPKNPDDEVALLREQLASLDETSMPPEMKATIRADLEQFIEDIEAGRWIPTEYATTDFDLKSSAPFDTLHNELLESCCVLSYVGGDDGRWHAIVNAEHNDDYRNRDAAMDILCILNALNSLSRPAKEELDACCLREFNIGFHCGDSWGYVHQIPQTVVRAVSDMSCSIAVTLYPIRNADGTPKM